MRKIKMIAIVLTVVCCMSFSAYAGDIKIGVIDSQRILESSSYGKSAREEVQKKLEELTNDLKSREAEITELKEKVEREALVMSPEMREQKEREFRIKYGDLQAQQKKAKQEIGQLQMKLSGQIQRDVIKIVEGIGKKGGYTLILERGSLMYSDDTLDISDEVIEIYNKNYEKDMNAGGKN